MAAIVESKLVDNMTGDVHIPLYGGKGYVRMIDVLPRFGSIDSFIATAARTSFFNNKKKSTAKSDANLVKRLYKDRHTSPFEMAEFVFEICIPIYVMRQLIRHRTANVNEQSFRYSPAPAEYHMPELRMQSTDNKQMSSDAVVSEEATKLWEEMKLDVSALHAKYDRLIHMGVAREVARTALPVSIMTHTVWKLDLHNLFNFLRLRRAADAQKEIRDLADAIWQLVKPRIPASASAHEDSIKSITFSAEEQMQISARSDNKMSPELAAKALCLNIS
jgi:thymidylate synthase (FAD)